jgi:OOP family OmpA-OmpF porin
VKSVFQASFAIGVALAALLAGPRAHAQNLPLDRFEPAPAGDRQFGVPSPIIWGEATPRFHVLADYAHNPLVLRKLTTNGSAGTVVSNQLFLHLNVSLALVDALGIDVNVPVAIAQAGGSPTVAGQAFASPNKAQLGDLRGGLRFRIVGATDDAFQAAIGGYVWAPTGSTSGGSSYVTGGEVRGMPMLLLGGRVDRFVWALSGGPQIRSTQTYVGVTDGTQVNVGAGFGVFLDNKRRLMIGPEVYTAFTAVKSATATADSFKRTANVEILGDVRFRFAGDFEVGAGAGPGLTAGIGTPDFRGVFMLGYNPEPKAAEPPAPNDRDGDGIIDEKDACPETKGVPSADAEKNGCPPDKDGDGIIDAEDACPDVEGVRDPDPKLNGCPRDKDGDGILDKEDACPTVKGVRTTDPETNGCPPDKDGDGVYDKDDACPDVVGVPTDDPKTNGCPPDKDGDGILDSVDACPEEKGPADPDPKKNGCPTVHVTDKEIVILEQVQFDTGKATIKAVSDPLLDKVAAVFTEHTEIARVEVQGHTDNRGAAKMNRTLSQKRADAVAKALVQRGITKERLISKGYGPDQPIAENTTDEGRQQNRRVQFKILERTQKEKE